MSGPSYKVKAVYTYTSEHDDDLNFAEGQIVTVTQEEDDDWLQGEYKDESGIVKQGIFPKNFVERYEPVTPPRPARPAQVKQPAEPVPVPQPQAVAPAPESAREPELEEQEDEVEEEQRGQEPAASEISAAPAPVAASKPPPPPRETAAPAAVQASKPAPQQPVPVVEPKARSPPVADKPSSSSFKDRIAAFNRGGTGPQAPPKPGGLSTGSGGSGGFVKKTYMAPPPARNAYVPPPNQAPIAKVYRRDEEPEFANTQDAENEPSESVVKAEEPEEDQPKPMSLKERMAMLQQQQLEQQARHAEAASKKAKPKPPPKKTSVPVPTRTSTDGSGGAEMARNASQTSMSLPERPVPPARVFSDESARAAVSPEQVDKPDYLAAPRKDVDERSASEAEDSEKEVDVTRQDPAQDEEEEKQEGSAGGEGEDEDEDEDVDPEVRRRMELRERMAKMSGGMGMGMMFGAPPVPGAGSRKTSKPKSAQTTGNADEPETAGSPPQAIPVMPGMGLPGMALPGMGAPRTKKQEPEDELQVVREDDEDHEPSISQSHRPEELPDLEDIKEQEDDLGEKPLPPQKAAAPPSATSQPPEVPTSPRAAPPVPSSSRPPPAPSHESRPSDGLPLSPVARTAPQLPLNIIGEEGAAPLPPPHVSSSPLTPSNPPMSVAEKRASRPPPPVPGTIDTNVSSARAAPPPPPPPGAPPRARQSLDTTRAPPPMPPSSSTTAAGGDSDYDPYNYESNPLGVPTPTSGRTPKLEAKSEAFPPPPLQEDLDDLYSSPTAKAPPPPPHASAPRVVPPPPPVPPPAAQDDESEDESEDASEEEDDDIVAIQNPAAGRTSEELHHAGLASLGPQGRAPPPPPPGQAPTSPQITRSETEEFSSVAPRGMPPPPPPQTVVHEPSYQAQLGPPPPSEPAPRKSYDARKSLDVLGQTQARRSIDLPRPSTDIGDYIAADVDLGRASGWWNQRRAPPPALQGRSDVFVDFDESTTKQDLTIVTKHVYALYMDYSQSIITARFAEGSSEVELQQRHEPPPVRPRQDQLESAHGKIGARIAAAIKNKENSVVGDGSALALVHDLLRSFPEALPPIGTRAFGASVYANIGNASVQQHDEIRAGDVISFRNAKMQGHRGAMKQKYNLDLTEHVAVVVDWDGTKKKVRAWEQGRESKKVKVESFKLGDLRSGEVKIWRVMSKDWVGWGST